MQIIWQKEHNYLYRISSIVDLDSKNILFSSRGSVPPPSNYNELTSCIVISYRDVKQRVIPALIAHCCGLPISELPLIGVNKKGAYSIIIKAGTPSLYIVDEAAKVVILTTKKEAPEILNILVSYVNCREENIH